MEKFDLVEKVAAELNLTKKDSRKVIDGVFAAMIEGLEAGETVKVNGFGRFVVKNKPERNGVNPKTREKVFVPASKSVSFKPAEGLKAKIK